MRTISAMLCAGWATCLCAADVAAVNESAREIPVAYAVDVVVVGGSTGAVSAAVNAAEAGAKVFLAAPRPYLGDDVTATLRLWLEEGETPVTPLAKQLFTDTINPNDLPDPNSIPFKYAADRAASERHADTTPPSRLNDQIWSSASRDSVQFDDDVNVTVDLGKVCEVGTVRVRAFQAGGRGGYRLGSVAVATSDDKAKWTEAANLKNETAGAEDLAVLSTLLATRTRYLRFSCQKAADAKRLLLGEIEVVAPVSEARRQAMTRKPWPRPMHIKRTLDKTLMAANVSFLYNCYATDVLHDDKGNLCGIVMANRAGRQAVLAKTIIDATDTAVVARLAGARFRPLTPGEQMFQRVVIGGEVQQAKNITARVIEPAFVGPYPNKAQTTSGLFPIIEYTLRLPLADESDAAWAKADQQARSLTYHPEQQFTSDLLFQVPPNPIVSQSKEKTDAAGLAKLPLDVFRPQGVGRLLVLSGYADVSRSQAEKLLRPLALIDEGARVGSEAAREAKKLAAPVGAVVRGTPAGKPAETGEVGELLAGARPQPVAAKVKQQSRALPVLGRYDVVVVGGGTAGAPAGIAAARQKAKTLVIEQLSGLGGVGTTGAISNYCSGNRVGFTAEVEQGKNAWVIEQRMEWWRTKLLEAGADIWFGAVGCGALVHDSKVQGVVVATPRGRGVVLAKVVVDATGNADVAAAAGAKCVYTDASEFAMQGTGLPGRQLGATYTNTDYTYTDETDMVDVWHLFVYAKDKFAGAFDLGQLIDTRQRRQIVGDYTLRYVDQVAGRTFPDSIALCSAGYDTHGYIIDPCLLLRHPVGAIKSYVPFRCLLPQGLDGLLVTGIGLSAHRDAQPVVRMEPDIQNQGYAAGVAAAMAGLQGTAVRHIDVRALQKHLVEIGNLPEAVLEDKDSFPPAQEALAAAVKKAVSEQPSLAIVLDQSAAALPLLREAYRKAQGADKLAYAKILGMLGDATGMESLAAELEAAKEWDTTPHWRLDKTDPQYGRAGWITSHLDNTLMALGRTGRVEAVPTMLNKLALLKPETAFSHHRAVYMAAEWLGDKRAAKPLAELLRQPGMGGHAVTTLVPGTTADKSRMTATRELILARTLYRCGDWEGLGEQTLDRYADDLRGHFARHARAVLAAGKQYRPQSGDAVRGNNSPSR